MRGCESINKSAGSAQEDKKTGEKQMHRISLIRQSPNLYTYTNRKHRFFSNILHNPNGAYIKASAHPLISSCEKVCLATNGCTSSLVWLTGAGLRPAA